MESAIPSQKQKTMLFVVIGLIVFFVCFVGMLFLWAQRYQNRIGPQVFIGPVSVSGLTRDLATQKLQQRIDLLLTQGVSLHKAGVIKQLPLSTLVGTDVIEDATFDVDTAVTQALRIRHSPNPFLNTWLLVSNLWQTETRSLSVNLSEKNIQKSIEEIFPEQEQPAQNARFAFFSTGTDWHVTTIPEQPGKTFAYPEFFESLSVELAKLDASTTIFLTMIDQTPTITQAFAETQTEDALRALLDTPLTLLHKNELEKPQQWQISGEDLSKMLVPTEEGIGIDKEALNTFLDPIAEIVERPAQNARFQIVDGRVVDFVENKQGQRLDREVLFASLNERIREVNQTETLSLIFITEEATIKTGDVNNLGVSEILGVGISSYKGSPKNRRANIQNGVNLLNGRLIAPDETVSLIDFLKPFEIDNGYLPELVIKGTKIIPEIGGGLCQIGTTTFRAVMNAGLPILERHNHSIVVNYYNDPANNKPGTDATIYEPAPDFKFKNDTGAFVLFQAENLTETQELRFTFWGTSDGRTGSYKPPTVIRWIPVGEEVRTETTEIEVGTEKCQEAHTGADTTFTYTVTRADGTTEETEFTSHYRPLPRICLVGVESLTPAESSIVTETVLSEEIPPLPDSSTP